MGLVAPNVAEATALHPQTDVALTSAGSRAIQLVTEPYGLASLRQPVTSLGTVAYDDLRLARVYSPVSGIVARVLAPLGAQVKSGQPLALLSSADMGAAKADLDRADANLKAAGQEAVRQEKLFSQKAASARDLESARDNLRRSEAERARAEQRFALLTGGKHAPGDQNFWLRSPIDGEVMARDIGLGNQVQGQYAGGASAALFTIADLDSLWLLADLHESDVGRVKIGARVRARPADPAALGSANKAMGTQRAAAAAPAKLTASTPAAPPLSAANTSGTAPTAEPDSTTTSISGTVNWLADVIDPQAHTLKVRCSVDNRDRRLRPNVKVVLEIDGGVSDVMSVPQASIVYVEAQAYVFVQAGALEDGRQLYRLRPVELDDDATPGGALSDISDADGLDGAGVSGLARAAAATPRRRTMKSGVRAGEKVVTHGADQLLKLLAGKRADP